MTHVILTGSPDKGFSVYGVFTSDTEAVQYAIDNLDAQWWLMPVHTVAGTKKKDKSNGRKI